MTEKELQEFKCPQCKSTHQVAVRIDDDKEFGLKIENEQKIASDCSYLDNFPFEYEVGKSKPKDKVLRQVLENSEYFFLINLRQKVDEDGQNPVDLNNWLVNCEKHTEKLIKKNNSNQKVLADKIQELEKFNNDIKELLGIPQKELPKD
jgi:hypothetical protein